MIQPWQPSLTARMHHRLFGTFSPMCLWEASSPSIVSLILGDLDDPDKQTFFKKMLCQQESPGSTKTGSPQFSGGHSTV